MKRLLFLLFLLPFLVSLPDSKKTEDVITFTPPLTGSIEGMVNIHGIENDTTVTPPSLNPDDWEILNDGKPIVHHSQAIGGQKIDPVGFYLTENNLALFYNSGWDSYDRWFELRDERGYAGSTNQAGSLIAFTDNWNIKDYHNNPVFDQPQRNWQGRNRTNPYALVWHPKHEVFYSFYGDFAEGGDNDLYPGRRALGLAKSSDLINWEYLSADEPLFHINTVKKLAEEAGSDLFEGYEDITRQGRLYAYGAIWHDDYVYLTVGGSIDRSLNFSMVIRAKDPIGEWEYLPGNTGGRGAHRPTPVKIGEKWYFPQNMRDPENPEYRAIGMGVSDEITEPAEVHYLFSTGHTSSAGVSRQLFAYKGKWYIAYRQDDGEGYRDMYIARQK
jgi:hypothetical protein